MFIYYAVLYLSGDGKLRHPKSLRSILYLSVLTLSVFHVNAIADNKGLKRSEAINTIAGGERMAIIVGINTYNQRSQLGNLKYAVNDADKLAKFFQSQGYKVDLITESEASKGFILNAIRRAGDQLQGNGTLVFAFSGHGFGVDKENYLAVSGTVASDIVNTGLKLSDLRKAIEATGAKKRILFIDACRDNPIKGAKNASKSFFADQGNRGAGENIFYSTGSGDLSFEDDELKHGVFINFVLKGLRELVCAEGKITFSELVKYVTPRVREWVSTQFNAKQEPHRAGQNTGQFVLAWCGCAPPDPAPLGMVKISNGIFSMGRAGNDSDFKGTVLDTAKPQHVVKIQSFWLSQNEVTVKEFREFINDIRASGSRSIPGITGCQVYIDNELQEQANLNWENPGFSQSENHPVVCVSREDIREYLKWLNNKSGRQFRLPSESEWEYAARAGKSGNYGFDGGEGSLCRFGNIADRHFIDANGDWIYKTAKCNDGHIYTAPVGSYESNAYHLSDMHGNVWEMVEDVWHDSYKDAPDNGSAWIANPDRPRGVVRGGSWASNPLSAQSAARSWIGLEHDRKNNQGFRLAHDITSRSSTEKGFTLSAGANLCP